jgi:hypothetical protein
MPVLQLDQDGQMAHHGGNLLLSEKLTNCKIIVSKKLCKTIVSVFYFHSSEMRLKLTNFMMQNRC